ncbi:unnamed protein product [Bursaphelenchus xylophilus]|uniref:(pine wood nematode) hypothetical protein n=1 Tax=Bursaphelenchus xylophilus TaxID=6326 RepID=A0A1I7SEV4_BURXY|nr:unnamed protein product [Bursaphelenchus xylophilus]CAG9113224.1 unnamed protein product [Bursaphelenchus xylophilus]
MKLLLLFVFFGLVTVLAVAQWGGYQQQGQANPFANWNNGGGQAAANAAAASANTAQTGNGWTGSEG